MFASISPTCWPWACGVLVYGIAALPSIAEPLASSGQGGSAMAVEQPGGAGSAVAASAFGAPVQASALADARGGSFLTKNTMLLDGTTSDNSAQNVVTGNNTIDNGSFSNMNGLPIVVQNSGANVLIQNAVIVNLQME